MASPVAANRWQSRERLWRHFRQPIGARALNKPSCVAYVEDSATKLQLRLEITVAGNQIERGESKVAEAAFKAFGGVALLACGSWLCEWLPGQSLADIKRLENGRVVALLMADLQLSPEERPVALLAEDAVLQLLGR